MLQSAPQPTTALRRHPLGTYVSETPSLLWGPLSENF